MLELVGSEGWAADSPFFSHYTVEVVAKTPRFDRRMPANFECGGPSETLHLGYHVFPGSRLTVGIISVLNCATGQVWVFCGQCLSSLQLVLATNTSLSTAAEHFDFTSRFLGKDPEFLRADR